MQRASASGGQKPLRRRRAQRMPALGKRLGSAAHTFAAFHSSYNATTTRQSRTLLATPRAAAAAAICRCRRRLAQMELRKQYLAEVAPRPSVVVVRQRDLRLPLHRPLLLLLSLTCGATTRCTSRACRRCTSPCPCLQAAAAAGAAPSQRCLHPSLHLLLLRLQLPGQHQLPPLVHLVGSQACSQAGEAG